MDTRSIEPVQEIKHPPGDLGVRASVTIFHEPMMASGKILICRHWRAAVLLAMSRLRIYPQKMAAGSRSISRSRSSIRADGALRS
jgi:hypothetical protein